MTPNHALFHRIRAFSIDEGQPAWTFEDRLAAETGWTIGYALRVVDEYRRFLYLAMTAGHPVTPSAQVDQAWHLHLTYTRSYWDRLCGQILGRPLHHDPTRGGPNECSKFHRQYDRTIASYRAAFGHEPPADIWPASDVRFGDDLQSTTVDRSRYWVIPKTVVRRLALGSAAACLLVTTAGCGLFEGWSLSPQDVLRLLPLLFVVAAGSGLFVRYRLRTPGLATIDEMPDLSWKEVAYLNSLHSRSGVHRVLQASLARLLARGAARMSPSGDAIEPTGVFPFNLDRIEREVFHGLPLGRGHRERMVDLIERLKKLTGDIPERLRERGCMMSTAHRFGVGCTAFLVAAGTFMLLFLLVIGQHLRDPFGLGLMVLCIPAIVIVGRIAGFVGLSPITRRGSSALRAMRRANRDLRREHQPDHDSAGMAVALFGTWALDGAPLAAIDSWFPQPTSNGHSSCGSGCGPSGGGGCGGGGCGGGGCGGGCGGG